MWCTVPDSVLVGSKYEHKHDELMAIKTIQTVNVAHSKSIQFAKMFLSVLYRSH